MVDISVIIPTHNPHHGRLARTLAGLAAQQCADIEWETLLIDNASSSPLVPSNVSAVLPPRLRVISEPQLGLSSARRRGLREAAGSIAIFADDDNVLAPNYVEAVLGHFSARPRLGAAGGKSRPEFEREPAAWEREFLPLLALRDLGETPIVFPIEPNAAAVSEYPECAPIGAGMALRRDAWRAWLEQESPLSDRRGNELTSGGDNDIVMAVIRAGWQVGYFPDLLLTHLIPAGRLEPEYLKRLNYGIQKTWMQVLARHGVNPWPAVHGWSVPLRKAKAWFTHRAWSSTAAFIRWRGACGHFDGRRLRPTSPG